MALDNNLKEAVVTWGILAFGVFVGILGKAAYRLIQNQKITRNWILINALLFGLVVVLAANIGEYMPGATPKKMLLVAGLVGAIGDRLILHLLAFFERKFTKAVEGLDFFVGAPVIRATVVEHTPDPAKPAAMGVEKLRDVLPVEHDLPPDMAVPLVVLDQIVGTKEGKSDGTK